jgi:hypothetical protein
MMILFLKSRLFKKKQYSVPSAHTPASPKGSTRLKSAHSCAKKRGLRGSRSFDISKSCEVVSINISSNSLDIYMCLRVQSAKTLRSPMTRKTKNFA